MRAKSPMRSTIRCYLRGVRAAPSPARFLSLSAPRSGSVESPESFSRDARTASWQRSSHMSKQSFAQLGVSDAVAKALAAEGIVKPFPVQERVLPDAMAGRDVLVRSPTGSVKSLAFGVPMTERLEVIAKRP